MLPAMYGLICGSRGNAVHAHNYWSLARTKRGEEERAAHHVERQEFRYWLPRLLEYSDKGRARRVLMFPGYIFVVVRRNWHSLCNTRGISSVVMSKAETPARIRDEEIDYLQALENEEGLVVLPLKIRAGDEVKIIKGPYTGVRGIIQGEPAAGRCKVLWTMFGKDVMLSVNTRSVELR